jgi:hypothetical protein
VFLFEVAPSRSGVGAVYAGVRRGWRCFSVSGLCASSHVPVVIRGRGFDVVSGQWMVGFLGLLERWRFLAGEDWEVVTVGTLAGT